MKINKFNESFESELCYKGRIIIEFEINRSKIINYSGAFSDNEVKKFGLNGILEKYIFSSLDHDNTIKYKDNFKNFNKITDYNLFDKDGDIIDDDIFDNTKKYNL